ncbi:hypothetical protein A2U01_0036655, partial [Trifolium medium]|nr:hypothetical protein [Trifolium medium]
MLQLKQDVFAGCCALRGWACARR